MSRFSTKLQLKDVKAVMETAEEHRPLSDRVQGPAPEGCGEPYTMPTVSVIIPAFNYGRFISEAIESALRQTYPHERTEIIVVDDGSTDDTRAIVQHDYAGRVQYIYQDNRGIAAARNRGVLASRGEIITFLDADDLWYPERIRKVVETLKEKRDAVALYHPIALLDASGSIREGAFHELFGYREHLEGRIANDILSGRIFCGGSSFAFRRSVMDRVFPVPEDVRRGVDYYMAALSSCLGPVAYVPEVMGQYRYHGSNVTMLAGQGDAAEMARVNREFAHMRERLLEKMALLGMTDGDDADQAIVTRLRAKELIFYNVIIGKRLSAIRHIPELFTGKLAIVDIVRGLMVTAMAFLLPASLYPAVVRGYGQLKESAPKGNRA